MYTKLKYSRVTQFDISSGAVAALFAGFIGFLISEKFGFELIDSADFYYIVMYVVFLLFSIKLLLKLYNDTEKTYHLFTPFLFLNFYTNLWYLFLNILAFYLKKFKSYLY